MRRLLVFLLAILGCWLGPVSAAPASAAPTSPVSGYADDGDHYGAVLTYTTTERGPPATYRPGATYDAVDPRSHGAWWRSGLAASPLNYNYNTPTLLVHVASVGSTTWKRAQGLDGALASSSDASVAAKSGDDMVDVWRAVGPDEAADIARSNAYRPGPGQIGKYFYPTRGQAENLAGNYTKRGIGAPYTLTSGRVPRSILDGVDSIHPAGEGPAWFFQNSQLSSVCSVTCHGRVG